jgi:hypothetical protein
MTDEKSEECIHGLTRSWCGICLHGPDVQTLPAPTGMAFRAKYPGWCPGCERPIRPGQRIQRWDDERLYHAGGKCNP